MIFLVIILIMFIWNKIDFAYRVRDEAGKLRLTIGLAIAYMIIRILIML